MADDLPEDFAPQVPDETPAQHYERVIRENLDQIRQAHAGPERMDALTREMEAIRDGYVGLVQPPRDG
jgi:hypothetical protein